jgi:hypothetical protein
MSTKKTKLIPYCRSVALQYYYLGFNPMPLRRKDNKPLRKWKPWQTERIGEDYLQDIFSHYYNSGVAIICGEISDRLLVIDIDPRNGGDVRWQYLVEKYGDVPHTVEVLTPGGGRHIYLRVPEWIILTNSKNPIGKGIDVQWHGSYVVAPPTRRGDKAYCFRPGHSLDDVPIALCPQWLLNLLMAGDKETKKEDTTSKKGKTTGNETVCEIDDAEIAEWMELVPSLKKQADGSYLGRCPLHDDQKPSFTVGRREVTGKLYYRCWADCPGTKRFHDGVEVHYGDLRNLQELLGIAVPSGGLDNDKRPSLHVFHRLELPMKINYLRLSSYINQFGDKMPEGKRVWLAVSEIAIRTNVDLASNTVYASYRSIARIDDQLDTVVEYTGDTGIRVHGKPILARGSHLKCNGNRIRKGIEQLKSIGVIVGRKNGTTTFDFTDLLARLTGESLRAA